MAKEKKIIINGDDFAYSEGVNQGIIRAYQEGILTSTTVMANLLSGNAYPLEQLQTPTFPKPPIGIGVHLNITTGLPLSSGWVEKKFSRPFRGENNPKEWQGSAWHEYIKKFSKEQIRDEYSLQIKKVKEIFGEIDHLDSHHSSASYIPANDMYEEMAKQYNVAVRPLAPLSENAQYGGEMLIDREFYAKTRMKGIRTVDSADLRYLNKDLFFQALEEIKQGEVVEFMFHPALDSSQGEWRLADFALLTSPETVEKVKHLGITLTTYKESAY